VAAITDTGARASSPATRGIVAASLLVAAAVVAYILLFSGSGYSVHALFVNAGGLVSGGEVRVQGRQVGSISHIGLTPYGQADVTLSISGSVVPLHEGTEAAIRAVGQVGVTNNYVDLMPGPASAPALRDGAILPTTKTTGIVSLDAVLDAFDPATRASLQQFIDHSAQIFSGSGATYFNQMLARLSPALQGVNGFAGQLASDGAELHQFVSQTAIAATAVASRSRDLEAAVGHTATALSALASQRAALADSLVRAPGMLAQADRTFADTSTAATALRPTLREIPATATQLGGVLRALPPSLGTFTPALTDLLGQLPNLRRSLAGFAPLRRPATVALGSTATALKDAMPILGGLRAYGPDFLLGIFNGLVGISTAPYDASGHYVHLEFTLTPQQLLGDAASTLFSGLSPVPGLLSLRTHLLARCPGGDAPPAPDGSSPWIQKSLCDPSQDEPASVNTP
jgi:phospholipid/cholesterol/gamma-HCH transport system substrate-binding protein